MTTEKKVKMGRKPILNKEITEKIANAIRAGAYIETAAILAGVSRESLYAWLKKGNKQKNSIYSKFAKEMDKAFQECSMRDIINIDRCAMGQDPVYERDSNGKILFNEKGMPIIKKMGFRPDWEASRWRLERRDPKVWGKPEKAEEPPDHTPVAEPVQVNIYLPENGRESKIK
jgi:hypothetical protein